MVLHLPAQYTAYATVALLSLHWEQVPVEAMRLRVNYASPL